MKRYLQRFLTEAGESRAGDSLDPRLSSIDLVTVGSSIGLKVIRGYWWKLRLRHRGLLLVGRGVAIRNSGHIRIEGTLIVEDNAEIQGLADAARDLREQSHGGSECHDST